jgi:Icc-related predicted phosphoesterase
MTRKKVRVLAVSDEISPSIHRYEVRELHPDLVVSCGDLPFDYLEYLVSTLNIPLVFVPGNHDPDLKPDPADAVKLQPISWTSHEKKERGPGGCVNIDERVITVAGLRVAGLGGSIRYSTGPNQYTQRQMRRRALKLEALSRMRTLGSRTIDLLITHAPPLGIGDAPDVPHQGIQALHRLTKVLEPNYLLHGHIHPHGFQQPDRKLASTTVVNVIPYKLLEIET